MSLENLRKNISNLRNIYSQSGKANTEKEALEKAANITVVASDILANRKGIPRELIPALKSISNKSLGIVDDSFDELSLDQANNLFTSIRKESKRVGTTLNQVFKEAASTVNDRKMQVSVPKNLKDSTISSLDDLSDLLSPEDEKLLDFKVPEYDNDEAPPSRSLLHTQHVTNLLSKKGSKLPSKIDPDLGYIISHASILIQIEGPLLNPREIGEILEPIDDLKNGGFYVLENQLILGLDGFSQKSNIVVKEAIEAINDKSAKNYVFNSSNPHVMRSVESRLDWIWLPTKSTITKLSSGNRTIGSTTLIDKNSIAKMKNQDDKEEIKILKKVEELKKDPSVARIYQDNRDDSMLRSLATRLVREEEVYGKKAAQAQQRLRLQQNTENNANMKILVGKKDKISALLKGVLGKQEEIISLVSNSLQLDKKPTIVILNKGMIYLSDYLNQNIYDKERNRINKTIPNAKDRKSKITEVDIAYKNFKANVEPYYSLKLEADKYRATLRELEAKINTIQEKIKKETKKEMSHLK